MPRLPNLASGFKTLREVDLKLLRTQTEEPFHISIVGDAGTGKAPLINQLLTGAGPLEPTFLHPVSEHQLSQKIVIQAFSRVIALLDASQSSHLIERPILDTLRSYHVPIVIYYNKIDLLQNTQTIFHDSLRGLDCDVIAKSATDRDNIFHKHVPVMMRIYKGQEIVLACHLPMLREPVSRKLIEDACFISTAYSLTSGLAELSILLTVLLNIPDMIVLTKNLALMAYKMALAFGSPSDWPLTIAKVIAIIGTGFLWRIIARQPIGLIPVVGAVPKLAVAYVGTYAIGRAIYRWCANNEKVSLQTLRADYAKASVHGRKFARLMLSTRRKSE